MRLFGVSQVFDSRTWSSFAKSFDDLRFSLSVIGARKTMSSRNRLSTQWNAIGIFWSLSISIVWPQGRCRAAALHMTIKRPIFNHCVSLWGRHLICKHISIQEPSRKAAVISYQTIDLNGKTNFCVVAVRVAKRLNVINSHHPLSVSADDTSP